MQMNHWTIMAAMMLSLLLWGAGCGEDDTEVPVADPAPAATEQPAENVDAETKVRFDTLRQQVTEHIRKRDFGGAETGLAELERMSTNLPESMRQQIATLRAALAAARGGSAQAPAAAPAPAPAPEPAGP